MPNRSSSVEVLIFDLESEAETDAFGVKLASYLQPGDTVALIGTLGAGKTRLVKAMTAALGVPAQLVNSPTFTLIQEYAGNLPIRHCDVYRLKSPREFPELGLDDLFAPDGIALIEWADRVTDDLPEERIAILLEATGPTARRATVMGHGPRGIAIVRSMQTARGASKGP